MVISSCPYVARQIDVTGIEMRLTELTIGINLLKDTNDSFEWEHPPAMHWTKS